MFRPDARVGARQRACSGKSCQRQRRAETQARWRSRNPSYQAGYRLKRRKARADAAEGGGKESSPAPPPTPLRPPADLAAFPWDAARSELGFAGADLLMFLAALLVRLVDEVKDEKLGKTLMLMRSYEPTGRDP